QGSADAAAADELAFPPRPQSLTSLTEIVHGQDVGIEKVVDRSGLDSLTICPCAGRADNRTRVRYLLLMSKLPAISLFSGVGGLDLGAERAGFDIRAAGAPGELEPEGTIRQRRSACACMLPIRAL